jgi:hypothetical protein
LSASLSANTFTEGSSGITLNLQAEDAQGAPVPYTSPVSVLVTKSGSTTAASNITVNGGAASSSTTVGLNTSGALAVTLADNGSGADAGTYTVTIAPTSGASYSFPTQTLTFTETAASLDTVAFSNPSTAITVPVTAPSAQYTLQLEDQFGNAVAQSGVNVQVYAAGNTTIPGQAYGQATVNGSATSSSSPVTVTTNAQGQATVTLDAEAFNGAVWTLFSAIPAQTGISALTGKASAGMTVSDQVPASIGVGLQDATATSSDFNSTGYAVAGDAVNATVTMKDQYGIALTGSQTVQLVIPPGLSGAEPAGATLVGESSWVQGASNTVTVPVNLDASGQAPIGLEAWSEGSATVTASVPGLTSTVNGSATVFVQPGSSTAVNLFNNGKLVNSSNELSVTANSPVLLTVEPTDVAGNPVAATYSEVVSLNPNSTTGSFRLTPTGADVSTVDVSAGQASVSVYYVNSVTGTTYLPTAAMDANGLTISSSSASVGSGGSASITAAVYDASNNLIAGQSVTASVPSNEGTVTAQVVTGSTGVATFTYTAPTTGSGSAVITISVPGTNLTKSVTISY